MIIEKLLLREGMIENLDTFSEKRNLIYSKTNTKGKSTFVRLLFYALGYPIPNMRGIKYEDIITYQNNLAIISQKDSKKNSSNYFLTAQFTQFIKKCRSNFDYIIIDTPPMGACVDVEAIINHSDSSVMVVREDWSEIGAINDLCDVLKQNDQDFIGFILNAFHRSIFSNDSYSHYGDYQRRTTSNLHK